MKNITREEFRGVIEACLQGKTLSETESLSNIIPEMEKDVIYSDRFVDFSGHYRKEALKKPRDISKIELFLPEDDARRIRKMSDPISMLEHVGDEIKIFSSNGSYIKIRTLLGEVEISDEKKRETHILDADDFINTVFHRRL